MHARLFRKDHNKKCQLALELKPMQFNCLGGNDVISAKISDHHPVQHDDVLFWNIMMQGKTRNNTSGLSFNNGFGIIESDEKYCGRLEKIALVIAEIVELIPDIEVISLCEGPIQTAHLNRFVDALRTMPSLQKFNFDHLAALKNNWGLSVTANKRYQTQQQQVQLADHSLLSEKLTGRITLVQLTQNQEHRYIALAHFPYGGDVHVTESQHLSLDGKKYSRIVNHLLTQYHNDRFIICADFNMNPYLLGNYRERELDKIHHHNSLLILEGENSPGHLTQAVTVDGILLSRQAKQVYMRKRGQQGLFARLLKEHSLVDADENPANTLIARHHSGLTL